MGATRWTDRLNRWCSRQCRPAVQHHCTTITSGRQTPCPVSLNVTGVRQSSQTTGAPGHYARETKTIDERYRHLHIRGEDYRQEERRPQSAARPHEAKTTLSRKLSIRGFHPSTDLTAAPGDAALMMWPHLALSKHAMPQQPRWLRIDNRWLTKMPAPLLNSP